MIVRETPTLLQNPDPVKARHSGDLVYRFGLLLPSIDSMEDCEPCFRSAKGFDRMGDLIAGI